jgi:hypothetical protein
MRAGKGLRPAVLAWLAGLTVLGAAAAQVPTVPTVPRGTPYQVARRLLLNLGHAPVAPARPRCAEGREEICRAYGEVERCAADGIARCFFLWAKDGATFEVETRGREELTVDRVRCRTGCG